MGVEEQHLARIGPAPVIALKRDPADDRWVAWLMELNGLSARAVYFAATLTVVEAKDAAVRAAIDAGWRTP
jgi:hypothetical protein